ncbi:unnamed protein product, partial [Chrysoparadoxa australica]
MIRFMTTISLVLALAACGGGGRDISGDRTPARPLDPVLSSKQAKQLFGAKAQGSDQSAAPLGGYAKGCLAGGVQLPETGPTWQAMRLSRNRNWGHPELIDYVQD